MGSLARKKGAIMRVRLISLLFVLLLVKIFIPSAVVSAQSRTGEPYRATLAGLPGVRVVAQATEGAEEAGYSTNQLQADVELRLQQTSIPVLDRAQALETAGFPHLYVSVDASRTLENSPDEHFRQSLIAFEITLEFVQSVTIVRQPDWRRPILLPSAVTWATSRLVTVGSNLFLDEISQRVRDKVDEFSNDFQAANKP
jgi:hypothetical protein